MILAIIGTILILYSILLSPAFLEPSDLIVSTAWIAATMAADVPSFLIAIWIVSGYIAFIAGTVLLGHSIIRRIPAITSAVKNPIALVLLVAFLTSVICLWFYYVA